MPLSCKEIIEELDIKTGDTLYVKSSMNYLHYGIRESSALLEALTAQLGNEGTLVMPSFPYPNDLGRSPNGYIFDVRKSPSQMGLLSEMFRRFPGTLRSEHYWVPICAWGKLARELTEGQRDVVDPFGCDSSFRRLLNYPTKIVGLGVTTNYNIFVHVVDFILKDRYPFKVFSETPIHGTVIDWMGRSWRTETIIVLQETRRLTRPSNVIKASAALQQNMRHVIRDGAIVFAIPGQLYFDESLRLGREALDHGQLPPWLVLTN